MVAAALPGLPGPPRAPQSGVAPAPEVPPLPGAAACRIVAVATALPPTDTLPPGPLRDADDYLVFDGAWVAAKWARRRGDREAGWRFWSPDGRALQPTHWLTRPPVPSAVPAADRLLLALPSGVALSPDGTILSDMAAVAATLRPRSPRPSHDDGEPARPEGAGPCSSPPVFHQPTDGTSA